MKTQINAIEHNADVLLNELKDLEIELHQHETRRNRARLGALLHPDFIEFGRSGRQYSRAEVLSEFEQGSGQVKICARNFKLALLAGQSALLTYMSFHVDAAGNESRHTLRSSIWIRSEMGWQMRFHQGTPASEGPQPVGSS
jgi:hypothetical protein